MGPVTVYFQKGEISGTVDVDMASGEIKIVLRFDKDPLLAALMAPMLSGVVGDAVSEYLADPNVLRDVMALRR